jgi:hypothetical protein
MALTTIVAKKSTSSTRLIRGAVLAMILFIGWTRGQDNGFVGPEQITPLRDTLNDVRLEPTEGVLSVNSEKSSTNHTIEGNRQSSGLRDENETSSRSEVICQRDNMTAKAYSACKARIETCISACERGSGHGAGLCAALSSFLKPLVDLA